MGTMIGFNTKFMAKITELVPDQGADLVQGRHHRSVGIEDDDTVTARFEGDAVGASDGHGVPRFRRPARSRAGFMATHRRLGAENEVFSRGRGAARSR